MKKVVVASLFAMIAMWYAGGESRANPNSCCQCHQAMEAPVALQPVPITAYEQLTVLVVNNGNGSGEKVILPNDASNDFGATDRQVALPPLSAANGNNDTGNWLLAITSRHCVVTSEIREGVFRLIWRALIVLPQQRGDP